MRVAPQQLRHVRVADVPGGVADGSSAVASIHIHQLFDEEPAEETADDGEESNVAFSTWTLPSLEFDGLWESLHYEEDVKSKLLRYVSTAMRFSELGVNARVICWNRVVLLHVRVVLGTYLTACYLCEIAPYECLRANPSHFAGASGNGKDFFGEGSRTQNCYPDEPHLCTGKPAGRLSRLCLMLASNKAHPFPC